MRNFRREGKVGEWAIGYSAFLHRPVVCAKIVEVNDRTYWLSYPHPLSCWDKNYCATFETEKEARKEYDDFVNNRDNYAYEG